MSRPHAREAAMQLVFEQLFGGDGEEETLVDLIEYTPDRSEKEYIDRIVSGVHDHAEVIDKQIEACLKGWTLSRISKVDHAVLRLAVYEMEYEKTAPGIVINEAVELTRKYSSEATCGFVNGVLGTINRKMASAE